MPRDKTYEAGDAIWAPDPYHTGDPTIPDDEARPWLVISIPQTYPHHGDDYVCAALTSVPKPADANYVPLADKDWIKGMPRKASWIDTETLLTIKHSWTDGWIGRVSDAQTNRARRIVKQFF